MLGAHVAATSQHLAKLRAAGLVSSRREGTYRADGTHVRDLLETAMPAAGDSVTGGGAEASQRSVPLLVPVALPLPVPDSSRRYSCGSASYEYSSA
ncbi:hypothetical protein [Streptomyces formicae]|uniref:Helix-turn-helix transcriptional regulator n=1 Tax=Streptomyces formicae TaxID=1616117 RepID=A0ABY3WUY1_9ACTN|nr:helix-turn-helix transcriptional regulator [Streptomyces formicae]